MSTDRPSGVATEAEMREAEVPWPGTIEELADYIRALVDRPHDYGTSAYAMSLAAVAAFQYIAKALGTTGFQASCADLDILRRTRGLKGPFILLKAEDLLYPQYDLRARLEEFITESLPWAGEQARKLLNERVEAHANAVAHWRRLATEPAK